MLVEYLAIDLLPLFGRYGAVTGEKHGTTRSAPPEARKPEVTSIGDVMDCGWQCRDCEVGVGGSTDDDVDGEDAVVIAVVRRRNSASTSAERWQSDAAPQTDSRGPLCVVTWK